MSVTTFGSGYRLDDRVTVLKSSSQSLSVDVFDGPTTGIVEPRVSSDVIINTIGGFIDYNDTGTASSPITLTSDTWTTVTNNGSGAFTNTNYPPANVTQLMNLPSGFFDFSQLSLGDYVLIRNDFTVTPQTNNASLLLRYQLGNGGGVYFLEKRLGRLDEGSGIGYRLSLSPDLIYMGDENTRNNPCLLQVKLTTPGSLVNAGSVISVVKRRST